jgi:hypothetical protein
MYFLNKYFGTKFSHTIKDLVLKCSNSILTLAFVVALNSLNTNKIIYLFIKLGGMTTLAFLHTTLVFRNLFLWILSLFLTML